MTEKKNTSNEDDLFKKNLTVVSTLFFTISPFLVTFIQNRGEVVTQADLKSNLIMELLIYYALSLIIVGIVPLFGVIMKHILKLAFKVNTPSKDDINTLFIQNLLLSGVLFIIFSLMILVSFMFETRWGGLSVVPIAGCIFYMIKKLQFIKNIIAQRQSPSFWKKIIALQMIALILFSGLYYFVQPFIHSPKIEWEKDCYSFKNSKALVKIKGIRSVKNAQLVKQHGSEIIIPVQYYYINADTYLVIDFAVDSVIEGDYLFAAKIDEIPMEHNLLYIFDGSFDEKEKYIKRKREEINSFEEKIQEYEIKNQIDLLCKAYLNGNKIQANKIFDDLKSKNLSPKTMRILLEMKYYLGVK